MKHLELVCEEEPQDVCEVIPHQDGVRIIIRGHSMDPYEETSVVVGSEKAAELVAWLEAWLDGGTA